ncbi:argininosuccinate lyase [Fictibacillus sp. WQ 8-8]|uniref:argininosuccinate lyase n=1 Tax=unclassified Fictibacillus TaxID=2644029 RepID=UPI0007844FA1|nr:MULTISPECIES: argininosuccinate lyase [unclassified Fictibacillus]MCQ6266573.1 argininosuccinate lyase [Fictibacillus sp. WQ 8-8]MED2971494.1 argininosuccinate lyase [Fictibacillus sp. B-59209]SFD58684.1 argininosuccinate lyase [Bacillus sp. OV194]
MTTKLWGGRFTEAAEQWVDEFGASISFDKELVEEDLAGSIAHVTMLSKCGIITEEEAETIRGGLQTLLKKAQNGELEYKVDYEDIHLNLEKLLTDEVGPVGGKLHTARSRNDQVATDIHLYMKKQVSSFIEQINQLQTVLVSLAEEHVETILPGYTHLQRAQPVSFAHHIMAYFWMFQRDKERLSDSMKRIDLCPLGAGALAGTTFPIDRAFTAQLLGFEDIYQNSLDAVSDRDFLVEFCSNASLVMMHLSRFCEELILWSSQEFQFVEISDSFATGSSMMPQKKNPDMAELIRGKTGRVYGSLTTLLTVLKGLPLAYNKDMQEDKEPLFDAVTTLKGSLSIFTGMIESITVRQENMQKAVSSDFSNATELADYLVNKGIPFREAHEIVGKLVLTCIQKNVYLLDLSFDQYLAASSCFEKDVFDVLQAKTVVSRRNSAGGTGFEAVRAALEIAKTKI